VAPIARQAELACDAAGGRCRVARSRDEADRIAAVTCGVDGNAWRLDAEDRTGRVVWSVVLTGDVEARARKAGLWIARAEEAVPPAGYRAASAGAPAAPPPAAASAEAAPNGEAATNVPPPDDGAPPAVAARVEESALPPVSAPQTKKTYRRLWIGSEGSVDVFVAPAATNVCQLNASGTGPATPGDPYNCVDPGSNAPFPGSGSSTNALIENHGDLVQSGFVVGSPRISLALDWAVSPNLLVGARLGAVFERNPTSKSAVHDTRLEARATYLFGEDAILQTLAPMAFVGLGVGYLDAHVEVPVFLGPTGSGPPVERPEEAWVSAGPALVEAGGGLRILLTDMLAATIALKFEAAFGAAWGAPIGAAPEAGLQLGF